MKNTVNQSDRAFFNYITGGRQSPPSPYGGPPTHSTILSPPSQSPKTWNLEGMFDILVTEICFVNLMSCLLYLMLNIVL
jgi:hypothetical protein